ncbi:hypothetical protein Nepgr_019545 [Nepenthes gracilis]|uniref:Uncharacterized protein n=1 Tax=Nepenthes gracilis TaxID=150966 RepID=A0AAD3SW06_NEPGR|nr:hypothetical protein Nepgr_019545 [Nepenthes gracilis]
MELAFQHPPHVPLHPSSCLLKSAVHPHAIVPSGKPLFALSSLPHHSVDCFPPRLPASRAEKFSSQMGSSSNPTLPSLMDFHGVLAERSQLSTKNIVVPLFSKQDSNEENRHLSVLPVTSMESDAHSPIYIR